MTRLDSGLRVVSETMPGLRSVALSVMMGVGSRNEDDPQAGLSHFLEHLLFKGTDRFSSLEIDQLFDGMGAEINAGTDKETTTVYARFLDRHLDRAFDVISDMVLRSTYPDIDSERQVVIEEIAMYEDEPSDKVHDVLARGVFGDSGLGKPIIGKADVIANVSVEEIAAYHDKQYVAGNIVVAAAGNVEHDRLVELAKSAGFDKDAPAPAFDPAPVKIAPTVNFWTKETEQVHIALGARGIPRGDDRRFALRLLDTILGGSTSSRLFQEVREKRGLAYSVYSYSGSFRDAGHIGMYVGTRPDRVGEALETIGNELHKFTEFSATDDELSRAKENAKGRVALAMESPAGRMGLLASSTLFEIPILTLDEIERKIDQVTIEQIGDLARELYDPTNFSAAAVGADEDAFRVALTTLNPDLVGATA